MASKQRRRSPWKMWLDGAFLHCIGVRFALDEPWQVVKAAIWAFARTRDAERHLKVMSGRNVGIHIGKEGIERLLRLRGFTYLALTPRRGGCYIVLKGYEDWHGAVAQLLQRLKLDATARCIGATCLEVAVMLRDNQALQAAIGSRQCRAEGNHRSLAVVPPVLVRRGRRKIHAELEVYRIEPDLAREQPGDPPGIAKLEARSKVASKDPRRSGWYGDHLHTDYDDPNHLRWLCPLLLQELLAFTEVNGLTVVPRVATRAGLPIPKDYVCFKRTGNTVEVIPGPGAARTDAAVLREIAATRRLERNLEAARFQLRPEGMRPRSSSQPGVPAKTARRTRASTVYLDAKPAPLDPGWRRLKAGRYHVAIQEACRVAHVANNAVKVALGLRLHVTEGPWVGTTIPTFVHVGQQKLLAALLSALGVASRVATVEPADFDVDSLVGRELEVGVDRRDGRLSITFLAPVIAAPGPPPRPVRIRSKAARGRTLARARRIAIAPRRGRRS